MPPLVGMKPGAAPTTPTWVTECLERYAEGTAMVSLDREATFYDPHPHNDDPDRKLPDWLGDAIADLNGTTSTIGEAIERIQEFMEEHEHTTLQIDVEDGVRSDRQWLTCTIVEHCRTLRHIRLIRFRWS